MEKTKVDSGAAFMASLTGAARRALGRCIAGPLEVEVDTVECTDSDEESGFSLMTSAASKALRNSVTPDASEAKPVNVLARYGLVESSDGEWARLYTFKSAHALAKRLQELEGSDSVVWCFYGIPLMFTRGPRRHIQLPGSSDFMQIPSFTDGPSPIVSEDVVNPIQEDGYIGPIELATGLDLEPEEKSTEISAANKTEDEDDDD